MKRVIFEREGFRIIVEEDFEEDENEQPEEKEEEEEEEKPLPDAPPYTDRVLKLVRNGFFSKAKTIDAISDESGVSMNDTLNILNYLVETGVIKSRKNVRTKHILYFT